MKNIRLLQIVLSAVLMFGFVACSDDDKPETPNNNPDNPQEQTDPIPNIPTKDVTVEQLSQALDVLAKETPKEEQVALAIAEKITADDFNTISQSLKSHGDLNTILDLSKTEITTVPTAAFEDVPNLTGIVLPNAVVEIQDGAFKGCKTLRSVTLSSTLQKQATDNDTPTAKTGKIGVSAFEGCTMLSIVFIPENIVEIGEKAFLKCESLKEIHIANFFENSVKLDFMPEVVVFVPKSIKNTFLASIFWNDYNIAAEGEKFDPTAPKNFGGRTFSLEEAAKECLNFRYDGSYARTGYTYDLCRGDEVWNSGQVWYLPYDDYNSPASNEMNFWVMRDWYYTINLANYVLHETESTWESNPEHKTFRGQALFARALAYYNVMGYYQVCPILTEFTFYNDYSADILKTASKINSQSEVIELIKSDFKTAIDMLPTKGGTEAGIPTKGAAAGFLAKTLMFNHEYSEALTYLEGIINGAYGSYRLVDNYGDNFREGEAYENNSESIFEVEFADRAKQGTDQAWLPINWSNNPTNGNAIESSLAPGQLGGWADLSASNWLYALFKSERTKDDKLDPRLYWTIGTYEADWENGYPADGFGNVMYGLTLNAESNIVTNNNNGGIPIVKNTYARFGNSSVITGLTCGINIRLLRLAEIYLLAAEAINEISGPTDQAINYINIVRRRANLNDLSINNFNDADKLFEQIANVERPKELGCEFGRGFDLIRWGWFYNPSRLEQLKQHGAEKFTNNWDNQYLNTEYPISAPDKTSFDTYKPGHEYIPYYQTLLDEIPALGSGNCANTNTSARTGFNNVRPVVDLGINWPKQTDIKGIVVTGPEYLYFPETGEPRIDPNLFSIQGVRNNNSTFDISQEQVKYEIIELKDAYCKVLVTYNDDGTEYESVVTIKNSNIKSISVTKQPTKTEYHYVIGYEYDQAFETDGIEISAMYSNGTTNVIDNNQFSFGSVICTPGQQDISIVYRGNADVSTTVSINVSSFSVKDGQLPWIGQLGADVNTPFYNVFTSDVQITPGETKTISFVQHTSGTKLWHGANCFLFRRDRTEEYAGFTLNQRGWSIGGCTVTKTTTRDFEDESDDYAWLFDGAKVVLSITNNGDNTAKIVLDFTLADLSTVHTEYDITQIDSDDLYITMSCEGAYIVFE